MRKIILITTVWIFIFLFVGEIRAITIKGIKEFGTPHELVLMEMAKKFKAETGIEVKYDVLPYLTFREKMMVTLVGEIPEYDFIHFPGSMAGPVLSGGRLLPLDEFDKKYNFDMKDWFPSAWEKAHWKGQHLALPFKECGFVLFYRKDLFEKKGLKPPKTIEEYLKAAQALTDPPHMYGIALQAKMAVTMAWSWWDYLYAWGGEVLDKDWRPAFNTREGEESLQFFVDLINKYKVTPPGTTTYAFDEATSAVATGIAAMAPNWFDQYINFHDPKTSKVVGKVGIALMPMKTRHLATTSCWAMGIPKASKNPEAAYRWMEFVTRAENAHYFFENGAYVGRASPYKDPKLVEKYPELKVILEAMEKGRYLPKIPEMIKISDTMAKIISKAIAGHVTVKEALREMEKEIDKIMKEAGYYK